MAEFTIRVKNLKQDDAHPVSEAVILLKTLIADQSIIYDLDLALTEAVSNVICHAYPNEETGPLSIRIRATPGSEVLLEVTDQGRAWDQNTVSDDLPCEWAEGGRGIPLMTRLCDRVEFSRRGESNVVTLTKYIPPAAWISDKDTGMGKGKGKERT